MDVPRGGVGPQHINNAQHWQWILDAAAEVGIPAQFLANALYTESGVTRNGQTSLSQYPPGGASNVRGIAQLATDTYPGLRDAQGNRIVTDPFNDQQAIRGAAHIFRNWGTGGSSINTPGDQPFDPQRAVVFYNTRLRTAQNWDTSGRDVSTLPGATQRYLRNTGQGLPATLGIGSDANIPLGDIGASAARAAEHAAERSAAAGYELPQDVVDFLGTTAPELGGGPGSFDPNSPFPWQTPGRIGEAEGGILQHHALMPNNLGYNRDTQVWDVPTEQRFPGGTGIWGSQAVADWLPSAELGAGQDYLRHLGYGAPDPGTPTPILPVPSNWPNSQIPGVMTAGIDLSHWLAQQYGQQNSGMNFGGNIYDASGNFGTRGNVYDASGIPQTRDLYEQYRGNVYDASGIPQQRDLYEQAIGGVADPATYTGPDYSQYFGALGRGGYGLPSPGTYSGPGVGALPTPGTYANQDVGMTGLGYQGSSGITNLPDMTLAHQIGAGQLSNWVAQMNSAAHYSPLAASPGPVVYGSPGLGSQFSFPATNSGQIFGASGFTPASNSGLQYAVGGPPVY